MSSFLLARNTVLSAALAISCFKLSADEPDEKTLQYLIDNPEEYSYAHIILKGDEYEALFEPETTVEGSQLELILDCVQAIELDEAYIDGLDQGLEHFTIGFYTGDRNILAIFRDLRIAFGGYVYCFWDKSQKEVVYVEFDYEFE